MYFLIKSLVEGKRNMKKNLKIIWSKINSLGLLFVLLLLLLLL